MIRIECYIAEGCSSIEALERNIQTALKELSIDADISFRTVSEDEAKRLGLKGSPTVWINGKDIVEGGTPGIA